MIMMITEVPGRVHTLARLPGSGFVSRFFQPLLSSHRKIAGRTRSALPRAQEREQDRTITQASITQAWTAKQVTGSNAPLRSLAGETLASRFHAWRGASGRRYICSVFSVEADALDVGLPDFVDAIAMAVAREPDGSRRRISLFLNEATSDPAARRAFVAEALAKGAIEWHIHLLAVDGWQRRAVATDIESCRFADTSAVR